MASSARQFARVATRTTTRSFAAAPRQAFRQQGRRFYSSEPEKKSNPVVYLGLAAATAGLGIWFFTSGASASSSSFVPTQAHYQQIYNDIASRLEVEDYDDGSYGPVLVRLAWHCSGTYDKETKTGGSNGATMRFAPESGHGANAGLIAARDFLEPIKAKYPWITYSDLWILGGVCAVQEMLGPNVPYRPGRRDTDAAACTPDGRLPDASQGPKHLRDIFYRMGFDDREIVALSGGHAIGRCHSTRSGYEGPWTFSPTVVTNDFYRLLLDEKWPQKKWDGPKQFEDKTTKTLMMLPTDVALVQDKAFKPWVEKYAADNDLFFKDFSGVLVKLFELGVPFAEGSENNRWTFKTTNA
ncbi:hypothetical protein ACHAPV_004613 [Trichoderma viride]